MSLRNSIEKKLNPQMLSFINSVIIGHMEVIGYIPRREQTHLMKFPTINKILLLQFNLRIFTLTYLIN